MKFLIMKFSPFPCYFVPLRPKYLPPHPILKHPHPMFCLQCEDQVPHPYKLQFWYYNFYISGKLSADMQTKITDFFFKFSLRNEEVLLRVNEQRNILHEIRKRKANWIGHIFCRNCLLKQVIEGKIKGEMEVTRRRGRRRKKLLNDLKDRRGYSHLKAEALHRTMWRHRFGGGFGPVVRQNTE